MKQRYGCQELPAADDRQPLSLPAGSVDPVEDLAATFSNFHIRRLAREKAQNLGLHARWAIHDRKEFSALIAEAKTLIDGLQDITQTLSTAAFQKGLISNRIRHIRDTNTLQLVVDVTQNEYPDISDAASGVSDVLTMSTDRQLAIENWADEVDTTSNDEIADLESMTVTELKSKLRSERSQREMHTVPHPVSVSDKYGFSQALKDIHEQGSNTGRTCQATSARGQPCFNCLPAQRRDEAYALLEEIVRGAILHHDVSQELRRLAKLKTCRWHRERDADIAQRWISLIYNKGVVSLGDED